MGFYTNVIQIDENINSIEYERYVDILESTGYFKLICLKEISFAEIKKIKFEETIIIISGKLYINFIQELKSNLNSIYIIPKIIIFTKDKYEFLLNNQIYNDIAINHPFYNLGGVKEDFNELKCFLMNVKNNIQIMKNEEEGQLVFEYIDNKQKLLLPILYKALIEVEAYNINKFNESLHNKYYKSNKILDNLLNIIRYIPNIPIELLSKFYSRIYTLESNFYRDLNNDLRENKRENYLPYIQVLYEGIKLKSLPLASNNILYRGTFLSHQEISKIKNLNNKLLGLPGSIVFTKCLFIIQQRKKYCPKFFKK